jgi:hypothetical protein
MQHHWKTNWDDELARLEPGCLSSICWSFSNFSVRCPQANNRIFNWNKENLTIRENMGKPGVIQLPQGKRDLIT